MDQIVKNIQLYQNTCEPMPYVMERLILSSLNMMSCLSMMAVLLVCLMRQYVTLQLQSVA